MAVPPLDKSFSGVLTDTRLRLDLVERRLAKLGTGGGDPYVLPDRLGPSGMFVTDWNLVVEAGFYWSNPGVLNGPSIASTEALSAQVTVNAGSIDSITQEIYLPTSALDRNLSQTWRRVSANGGATWSTWVDQSRSGIWGQVYGTKFYSGSFGVAVMAPDASSIQTAVTFLAGYFSQPPLAVTAIATSGRLTCSYSGLSATGMTVSVNNWSPANSLAATVTWSAIGVGP